MESLSTPQIFVDSDPWKDKHYLIEVIKDPELLNCHEKFDFTFIQSHICKNNFKFIEKDIKAQSMSIDTNYLML